MRSRPEVEWRRRAFKWGLLPASHVHTLDEIGERISLTRERVRQIEAKTLRKLRDPLRDLRVLLEAA